MGKWGGRRLYKTDRVREFEHERDKSVRTRQIYETIDRQRFQWIVVLVAGIGFFLDGYTLFASNIALPMIAYVYWPNQTSSLRLTHINIATLAGTMFGQVLFGVLADKNGRKKMYGIELLLLIGATLGVVMCSSGAHDSMSVNGWLIFWRIMVGIGVGADYPLSAVITAEFAPTKHRARMIASVFFMQPLGQIAGNLVSLVVVAVSRSNGGADPVRTVDIMWRWVIGLGVIPGVLALIFRFAIPETPRFVLEIEDDPIKAEFDTSPMFGDVPSSTELEAGAWTTSIRESSASRESNSLDGIVMPAPAISDSAEWTSPITLNSGWQLSKADIVQYFWKEGNWRTLFATSMTWLLLDFGFYGIGLSSPQFLAKTWGSLHLKNAAPPWQTDDRPGANIYTQFMDTSIHALVILNIGSLVGMILTVLCINRLSRVSLQKYGFLVLAALFVSLGTVFITLHKSGGALIVALYIIGQVAFNFGPNATTYIIPAEVFPTRYRASCHGISAASGKLGSILVQIFSGYYKFGSSSTSADQTRRYGTILIVFAAVMIIGAVITHVWIPEPQHSREKGSKSLMGKNKTLEELALGRMGRQSQSVVRARRTRESG